MPFAEREQRESRAVALELQAGSLEDAPPRTYARLALGSVVLPRGLVLAPVLGFVLAQEVVNDGWDHS